MLVGLAAVHGRAAAQVPQDRSFSPQLFHVAPGNTEFNVVESAPPLPDKAFSLGLFFNYAHDQLGIVGVNPTTMAQSGSSANLLMHSLSADLVAAVSVVRRLQIGLTVPMVLYQTGTDFSDPNPRPYGTQVAAANGASFGDPRIHLKLYIFGHERGLQISLSHWLSIPIGDETNFAGEKHYTGFAGEPRLLFGFKGDRFRLGAFLGFHWRVNTSVFFSTVAGQQFTYGGALAIDLVRRRFTVLLEVYGHSNSLDSVTQANGTVIKDTDDSPLEADLAFKLFVHTGLSLNLGVGTGIFPGIGSPDARAYFGIAYTFDSRDRDHDGIPDKDDQCPDLPEDKDGFQDSDGCPEYDNDGDGIADKDDKCPNAPEDFDGFQDEDGCPDPDNDNDGVLDLHDECPTEKEDGLPPRPADGCPQGKADSDGDGLPDDKDKCPLDAEDKDGFQDEDGCPEVDNDLDGILDGNDSCPNQPEDRDGFQDDDGCPDPDNDHDGLLDKEDKCPNEPETVNGVDDEDGCPDQGPPQKAMVVGDEVVLLEKVQFDKKTEAVLPESHDLLNQVALSLLAHPEVRKVKIEAHTETAGARDKNLRISQVRAESVMAYLRTRHVAAARMESKGMGPDRPVANGKSARGREANQRVEIHVIDRDPAADTGGATEDATPVSQ